MSDKPYCNACYGLAEKRGRTITASGYCTLCDTRRREGLVAYCPSNGTEGMMFFERCEDCRHCDDEGFHDRNVKACAWGVLDRLLNAMCEDDDHVFNWHDPANLDTSTCPATCLRFTPKDYDGDDRDPPPPVDPNQMTFDDLDIPVEQVPVMETVR